MSGAAIDLITNDAPETTTTDTAAPAATTTTPATVPASQWDMIAASLEPEILGEKYLDQFKDKPDAIASLVTDAVTANRLIGSQDRIARPPAGAPRSEVEKFWNKLGRPETVEGYDLGEFKPTENVPWDEGLQSTMMGSFHKHGITNEQAQALLADYDAMQAAGYQAAQAQIAGQREAAVTELKTEWGASYDSRAALAGKVLRATADDPNEIGNLVLADGSRFGDHPVALKLFAKIGEAMKEDAFIKGEGPASLGLTPDGALAKIAELEAMTEYNDAVLHKGHSRHAEFTALRDRLYETAYPK